MTQQDTIAVIGAGVVGSAVALALAREGRRVLLLDRAAPGVAGASFGNVGHIASELVEPLPSTALLFGFWRMLMRFGGPLDLPAHQVLTQLPWMARFVRAAFARAEHTRALSPLVLPAASTWERWLQEIGRPELLRRHGHYEVSFKPGGAAAQRRQAQAMAQLGIKTEAVPLERLRPLQRAAGGETACGLWFPDSAHVLDPLRVVQALAEAALARGAEFKLAEVRALQVRGTQLQILTEAAPLSAGAAVVCAGLGSRALLAPFGLHAPLVSVRGYHIEVEDAAAFIDAPVLYTDQHVLVTPMSGRLRASTYMEFAPPDAPQDPSKIAALKRKVGALGYVGEPKPEGWVGARPILPDYLPGIGQAPGAPLYYAVGHQHIGLTLAPITGELVADLVSARAPRLPVGHFDLRRFGAPKT